MSNPNFTMQPTTHTISSLPTGSILLHSTNCFANWGAGFALALHEQYPAADLVYATHCDSFRRSPDTWPEKEGLVGQCLLIPPQAEKAGTPRVWIACLFTSYGYGRSTKKKAGKDAKGKVVLQTRSALEDLRGQLGRLVVGDFEVETRRGEGGRMVSVLRLDAEEGQEALRSDRETLKRKRTVAQGDEVVKAAKKEDGAIGVDVGEEKKREEYVQQQELDVTPPEMVIYSPKFNSGSFGMKWEETEAMVETVFSSWEGKWFVLPPPK